MDFREGGGAGGPKGFLNVFGAAFGELGMEGAAAQGLSAEAAEQLVDRP